MALYEHVFIVRQDVTAQQVETLTDTLKTLIAAQGGSVSKVEPWGLKSLAYLDNVLALKEAAASGADEALMLNTAGRLASGSRSNLFLVLAGVLVTPPPSEGALPGITRRQLLNLAVAAGIEAREAPLAVEDLELASEAFVSNSLIEVKPLARLNGSALAPGPVAAKLAQFYARLTRDR